MTYKTKAKSNKSTKINPSSGMQPNENKSYVFRLFLVILVPYVIGILCSSKILPMDFFLKIIRLDYEQEHAPTLISSSATSELDLISKMTRGSQEKVERMKKIMKIDEEGDPFAKISFVIHHNGNVDPCGYIEPSENTLHEMYNTMNGSSINLNRIRSFEKFDFDAVITKTFSSLLDDDKCTSSNDKLGKSWLGSSTLNPESALLSYCDMGKENTPVQLDHNELVPIKFKPDSSTQILPCHFHTREGLRISSLKHLTELARTLSTSFEYNKTTCEKGNTDQDSTDSKDTCAPVIPEIHLYAVPAGRVFMFAPSYVGEVFDLDHVTNSENLPVTLEVLSLHPRVFDIKNFFSRDESEAIVRKALNEKSETHRIKRSSTGATGYNTNSKRTSENGFDTHGKEAIAIKKRCFQALGFDDYIESMADGLQVLRYNKTTAYIPHLDWIDDYDRKEEHNFDSAGVGSNRFATILLYMSDIENDAGGETVFSKAWPSDVPESERVPTKQKLNELRAQGVVSDLQKGSWEEKMVAECRTRLAIKPSSARAVLFYSQQPNGQPENDSLHGGCPVLSGEKWAANLWVWNGPRTGYEGAPKNMDVIEANRKKGINPPPGPAQLHATFINDGVNPFFENAELYFQETFWGKFGFGDPALGVNTYEGHEWNVYVDGKPVKQWIINSEPKQVFKV